MSACFGGQFEQVMFRTGLMLSVGVEVFDVSVKPVIKQIQDSVS